MRSPFLRRLFRARLPQGKALPPLKDAGREKRLFHSRVLWASAFMVLGISAVLARLSFLQIVNHDHYTTLSHENRLKILPLPPPRGLIYSRDGVVLAENRPAFALTAVPENVEDMNASIAALRPLINLTDDEVEQFHKQLKYAHHFAAVQVKGDLSPEELATFAVNKFKFPGFAIEAGLARHYPLGEAMSHVVGYVGRISEADLNEIDQSNYAATTHIGKMGVEKARETLLHGRAGYQKVEVNAQGRILRVVERTPPVPGSDIYLTIDAGLQAEAIAALENYRGAVVVMDPTTGGILAFVSKPGYDPNHFVNGISRDMYKALNTSPDRPLLNRALQGQYPPGSTIKPMMALAGLYYGLRTPDRTTACPGFYSLPNDTHQYRDWLKTGHGMVNLKFSIAHSCDVYYYTLARDLGIKRLHAMLARFGLGSITGIDVPGEAAGLLPSPEWKKRARNLPWFPGETLIAGIGQGFMLSTPLQLAYAVSIIATRGEPAIPHFLGQIEDTVTNESTSPEVYRRPRLDVENPKYWDAIIDGMVEVVHGETGTAHKVGIGAPVRFAGKTGTAQVFGIAQGEKAKTEGVPERLQDHALFVAFAPVEQPQIAIAVVVEHGGGGSRTAAPIARKIIDYHFRGVTPPPENMPKPVIAAPAVNTDHLVEDGGVPVVPHTHDEDEGLPTEGLPTESVPTEGLPAEGESPAMGDVPAGDVPAPPPPPPAEMPDND